MLLTQQSFEITLKCFNNQSSSTIKASCYQEDRFFPPIAKMIRRQLGGKNAISRSITIKVYTVFT